MRKRKKKSGPKPKITPELLQKLEDAFSNGYNDREALFYAEIPSSTFYLWQTRHPKFLERKEALKLRPNMAAKKTVVASLGDVNTAKWYLEKKDQEFKPVNKIEHSGIIETSEIADIERSPEELAAIKALREARLKRIRDNSDKMV